MDSEKDAQGKYVFEGRYDFKCIQIPKLSKMFRQNMVSSDLRPPTRFQNQINMMRDRQSLTREIEFHLAVKRIGSAGGQREKHLPRLTPKSIYISSWFNKSWIHFLKTQQTQSRSCKAITLLFIISGILYLALRLKCWRMASHLNLWKLLSSSCP